MKALIQLTAFTIITFLIAYHFNYTKDEVTWAYGIYALLSILQRLDELINKK